MVFSISKPWGGGGSYMVYEPRIPAGRIRVEIQSLALDFYPSIMTRRYRL